MTENRRRGKLRLDQSLVSRGYCASREEAKRLILAGEARLNSQLCDKPSTTVRESDVLEIKERPRYVSRGGLKLEGALDAFAVDPAGKVCLDAGASTGGFTDCLLQRGARKVYAFDVGTNQLAWKIRSHPDVVSREKFNIRHMTPEDIGETVALVVADVSFISLTKILGPCRRVLQAAGDMVCLVKPQFELERNEVGKGGIVRDPALRQKAVDKMERYVRESLESSRWMGVVDSPVPGTDGNREFFAWIKPT